MTGYRYAAVNPETGKNIVKVTKHEYFEVDFEPDSMILERFPVPCGQCKECRLQYARDWANRCMLEAQYYDENWFITLTYDDEHVPHADGHPELLSLKPEDVTLFLKRLRKNVGKFRYFYCGEYGDETFRPHYHLLVFGLHLDDLTPWRRDKHGYVLYRSSTIEKVWSVDGKQIGNVEIGAVSWDSCCYVSRYVMKKQKGSSRSLYDDFGMVPEFVRMSRRPGIGREYYDRHAFDQIWNYNEIWLSGQDGGFSVKPCRYYDKLLDAEYPDIRKVFKDQRAEIGKIVTAGKLSNTDLSEREYRKVQEESLSNRIKCLRREL